MDLGSDLSFGFYRNVFRSLTSTGDKPDTALYLEDAPWITQTDTIYGKYRFDLGSRVSGELVVDYSLQEVDPRSKYVNIYTGFADGYEYTRGERLGIEQNLNWKLTDNHRLQAGLGYQRYHAIEAHTLPSPYDTGKAPTDQGMFYRNTDLPLRIYDAAYDNLSAYAQVQSEWYPRFSTMAGLRVDHHSAYGQSANPRLGAIWRFDDRQIFKLLYGEAFRAPSPDESLSSFGAFDGSKDASGRYRGTGFRVPNFSLEPEKAKTLSLVWDWRPRRDLNLITNVYRSQIRNLIVTLPSGAVSSIPGAILIAPENKGNAGEQTQAGIDLMAQWRFKMGPAWTGEFWGSASWITGRINEGEGVNWDLSYVAAQKLKLGATFRWQDLITVTPQLQWIGDTSNGRKKDRNHPPDRLETPGYTAANLHIGWHKLFDGRATLWLDIYNLFDARYYAAAGAGSRTFFDMPQQPRHWMASLEYRF
jgi:outer membrane receptor protein involved in Fe transport